jgi:hypothetical protein
VPPTVWAVEDETSGSEATFSVLAEDASGVQRVVIAYTTDGTAWRSADLAYVPQRDRWEIDFGGMSGQFRCFFQVVDGAGNVAVTVNKGLYFEPPERGVYLPLLLKDAPSP